jgi:hypothetical protein
MSQPKDIDWAAEQPPTSKSPEFELSEIEFLPKQDIPFLTEDPSMKSPEKLKKTLGFPVIAFFLRRMLRRKKRKTLEEQLKETEAKAEQEKIQAAEKLAEATKKSKQEKAEAARKLAEANKKLKEKEVRAMETQAKKEEVRTTSDYNAVFASVVILVILVLLVGFWMGSHRNCCGPVAQTVAYVAAPAKQQVQAATPAYYGIKVCNPQGLRFHCFVEHYGLLRKNSNQTETILRPSNGPLISATIYGHGIKTIHASFDLRKDGHVLKQYLVSMR